jgi:hypothetical protein
MNIMNKEKINLNVIETKLSSLSDKIDFIKSYNEYLEKLNDLALIALENPDTIDLKIDLNVSIIRKDIDEEESESFSPKRLMEDMLDADNSKDFITNLRKLECNLKHGPTTIKTVDLNMNNLSNQTFLALLSSMCTILKEHKEQEVNFVGSKVSK